MCKEAVQQGGSRTASHTLSQQEVRGVQAQVRLEPHRDPARHPNSLWKARFRKITCDKEWTASL